MHDLLGVSYGELGRTGCWWGRRVRYTYTLVHTHTCAYAAVHTHTHAHHTHCTSQVLRRPFILAMDFCQRTANSLVCAAKQELSSLARQPQPLRRWALRGAVNNIGCLSVLRSICVQGVAWTMCGGRWYIPVILLPSHSSLCPIPPHLHIRTHNTHTHTHILYIQT